jgi:hypothetical protein
LSNSIIQRTTDETVQELNGEKFMAKQLKALLPGIQPLSMEERYNHIDETSLAWKGSLDQVDDVLIFGVEIM